MTRDQIVALCKRAREHIEKCGIGALPITDKQRERLEELKKVREGQLNQQP